MNIRRSAAVIATFALLVTGAITATSTSASAAQSLKLPFAGGWNVTQGMHTTRAWDLQPPGAGSHNDEVLAVGSGTAKLACSDSIGQANVSLVVDGNTFLYAHLQASAVASAGITRAGVSVIQGQVLGRLLPAPKSFNGTCGSGTASHLHLEMPFVPISIDGVTFSASGPGYLTRLNSSNTRNTGAPSGDPFGYIDDISSPRNGVVHLSGWTMDPDARTTSIDVHVYLGEGNNATRYIGAAKADVSRTDVGAAFPGYGDHHGYDFTIDIGQSYSGPVFLFALNTAGSGGNTLLGVRSVQIGNPTPSVSFDSVESPRPGVVHVRGWAADPDDWKAPVDIHVYVGGGAGDPKAEVHVVRTDRAREDVTRAFPYITGDHGFDVDVPVSKRGQQTVEVFAINIPGTSGVNPSAGVKSTTISSPDTRGAAGATATGASTVQGSGWAADAAADATTMKVITTVDGERGAAGVGEAAAIWANSANATSEVPGEHGFNFELSNLSSGKHVVHVYAVNPDGVPGADREIATLPIDLPEAQPVPGAADAQPSASTSESQPVAKELRKFRKAPKPKIVGAAKVRHKITARVGAWKPKATKLKYRWKRNGKPIPGANSKSYVLHRADKGKRITVTVTVLRTGYIATARTSPSVRAR